MYGSCFLPSVLETLHSMSGFDFLLPTDGPTGLRSQTTARSPSGCYVTNIPTELLWTICSSLRQIDLLNLAKTCRHLNDVAARYSLGRMGMHLETCDQGGWTIQRCKSTISHRMFATIFLAFSVLGINVLHCELHATEPSQSVKALQKVEALLERVAEVREVELDFNGICMVERSSSSNTWDAWSKALVACLHVLSKKRCSSLIVKGAERYELLPSEFAMSWRLLDPILARTSAQREVLSPSGDSKGALIQDNTSHDEDFKHLAVMGIECQALLHWPLLGLLMRASSNASIRRLNMGTAGKLDDVSSESISDCLSRLICPNLEVLAISFARISTTDLCSFANKRAQLSTLILCSKAFSLEWCSSPTPDFTGPRFSYITHLHARSNVLSALFLDLPSPTLLFPCLKQLVIMLAAVSSWSDEFRACSAVVLQQVSQITDREIALQFDFEITTRLWIRHEDIAKCILAFNESSVSSIPRVTSVSSVVFSVQYGQTLPKDVPPTLPGFLHIFPSLKQITFEEGTLDPMNDDEIKSFLKNITKSCPSVEMIQTNETEHLV